MTHILVGESAVNHFFDKEWDKLEESILEITNGDIVGWDKEHDSVATLLDMLSGWGDFIELSADDLKEITLNTKIFIK